MPSRLETSGAVRNGQVLTAQQLANLAARMVRPRPALVQPDIHLPVSQRPPPLTLTLVSQRKVVVSIRIIGRQRNSPRIRLDRFVGPVQLVEHIPKIEEGQDVGRISLGGPPIKLLRPA